MKQNSGVSADTAIEVVFWEEDTEGGGVVESAEAEVRTLKLVKRMRSWMRKSIGSPAFLAEEDIV